MFSQEIRFEVMICKIIFDEENSLETIFRKILANVKIKLFQNHFNFKLLRLQHVREITISSLFP